MKKLQFPFRSTLTAVLVTLALAASAAGASQRNTLAITYGEGVSTKVDLLGSNVRPGPAGDAQVSRKQGRTRVKLHLSTLPHPQSLGSFYTTYLLWAVAPEGQAENLAELPHSKDFDLEVTTSFQTFGLIVTAEPHSAVRLPSPLVVAENASRRDTTGTLQSGRLEYGGATSELYAIAGPDDVSRRDYQTPLLVLGARHAVQAAKSAGAQQYASPELHSAQVKLVALEQTWSRKRKVPREFEGMARDVMRVSEHARSLAAERAVAARLAAERSTASANVARAESAADRAQQEAEQQRQRALQEQQQAAIARSDADRARVNEEQARVAAQLARDNEEQARAQAERARREADDAQREKAEVQRQLFDSLSTILETRREARGLIVSLSDVLFDFDRASLTPGAREKLSKLSGLLLAYAGPYRLDVEGHTDSIGTYEYNARLSRDRAESVRAYLLQAGLPVGRLGSASGFADTRPVASNVSATGRQLNRRVEIVIGDLDR